MLRRLIRASLLLAPLLALASGAIFGPSLLASPDEEGLFGRVTSVATTTQGVTVIIVDTTTEGPREVEVAGDTIVTIPGREASSAADISAGDFLAILAKEADGRLEARSILVKPNAAVLYAHITGAVLPGPDRQLIIMDGGGSVITADVLLPRDEIPRAEVVTVVVNHDLRTGRVFIVAVEAVDTKIARLERAIAISSRAGAKENRANLGARLRANVTGHLTTLQDTLNRVDPELRGFFGQDVSDASLAHKKRLEGIGLGRPALKIAGNIEQIDLDAGTVLVSPQEGPSATLKLAPDTEIRLFGDKKGALEAGHTVEAVYDSESGAARTIDVLLPALREGLIGSSLAQVLVGELKGTIDPSTNPPVVVVRLPPGRLVSLTTTPETRVWIEDQPAEPEQLSAAAAVKVWYEPATMEALGIETFDVKPDQAFVSGVVCQFVAKTNQLARLPLSEEEGNLLIVGLDGENVTLDVTDATIIEREGLRLTLHAVRVGDLVRPTSRYNTKTREVQKLALKVPTLRGIIRGRSTTPGGTDYLTISTSELDLVTVKVTEDTVITRGDERVDFETLVPEERVVSGLYDPLKGVASTLAVEPAKTLRASGTITSLAVDNNIGTLTTPEGEKVGLLIPKTAEVVAPDGSPRSISDLAVGVDIRAVFYRPDTVVVRIILQAG